MTTNVNSVANEIGYVVIGIAVASILHRTGKMVVRKGRALRTR